MPGENLLKDINDLCEKLGLIDSSSGIKQAENEKSRLASITALDEKDLDSLSNNLESRWIQIKDDKADYTVSTDGAQWLELARKISNAYKMIGIDKASLSILMPGVIIPESLLLFHPKSVDNLFVSSENMLLSADTVLKNLSPYALNQYYLNRNEMRQLSLEEMAKIMNKGGAYKNRLESYISKFSVNLISSKELLDFYKPFSKELLDFYRLTSDYFAVDFVDFKIKLKKFNDVISLWPEELRKIFYTTPIICKKGISNKNKQVKPAFVITILLEVLLAETRTNELSERFYDLWIWLSRILDTVVAGNWKEADEFCLPLLATINFPSVSKSELVLEFWLEYIKNKIEKVSYKNSSPVCFFRNLIEIFQNYFEKDYSLYQRSISFFLHNLCHNSAAANDFCITQIEVDGKSLPLIEMLFYCAIKSVETEKYLKAIAKWVALHNPAFICHSPALESVYQPLKLGSYFDFDELIKLIHALKLNPKLAEYKKDLLDALQSSSWDVCIPKIITLFERASVIHQDSDNDYFRLDDNSARAGWIRLAQILAGTGRFGHSSYFRILIPNLKSDQDEFEIPYESSPIGDYILAESGGLINLPTLIYLCEMTQSFRTLSPLELKRLSFNPYFHRLYINQHCPPPLQKQTIEDLYKLILESGYDFNAASALVETSNLIWTASVFYKKLEAFWNALDSTERIKLEVQVIPLWTEAPCSFSHLVESVKDGKMCFGLFAKYLINLVWNYAPWKEFPGILIIDRISGVCIPIRDNINPAPINIRAYAEYHDDPMIRTKLVKLMYSFMKYQFELEYYGNPVEFELFNIKNLFPQNADLLSLIDLFKLVLKDDANPHLYYAYLKETMNSFYWAREASFIPEAILIECDKLNLKQQSAKKCLKEMASLLKSKAGYYERWFKVNAVFQNFLGQIPSKNRASLKAKLLSYETAKPIQQAEIDVLIEKWTPLVGFKKKLKSPHHLGIFPLSSSPESPISYSSLMPERPHSYH